ncbi:MAG: PspC domain-containing protein [Phycisphaerae bacterium]|jgi:phage shock protein C|nr:PspC domain-containing protein [Phycisphaerae bacterium]NIP52852.1 PspC domain-containing protein [Phycisphaerae bacterium]NIS51873.1 PspC domain-containing protein [Phycisphaerae bacterium]NIU09391.1 PspC domain-containing protein [Phycisphaerae bacterium]NIU57625.1 PspC domain-containing protein [Phycisphaerae bacterium]
MKKLYRSENDSKIAGICGGIGQEFGVDCNIVRLATVFACIVSGVIPLVVTYLVGWIILPTGKPQEQ